MVTRMELIEKMMARQPHLSCQMIDSSVKQLLNILSDALCQGIRVEIRGFGSLERHLRRPRIARNPKTGTQVQTPSKYSLRFKCGKELRDLVDAARARQVPIRIEKEK